MMRGAGEGIAVIGHGIEGGGDEHFAVIGVKGR